MIHGLGDQLAGVREPRRVVRPGGLAAVFFMNVQRGIVIPVRGDIERMLHDAHGRRYPRPGRGYHQEAAGNWPRDAGLVKLDISHHVAQYRQPLDEAARGYLEGWQTWQGLSDPASPSYLFRQDGYSCLAVATLWSGRVPRRG